MGNGTSSDSGGRDNDMVSSFNGRACSVEQTARADVAMANLSADNGFGLKAGYAQSIEAIKNGLDNTIPWHCASENLVTRKEYERTHSQGDHQRNNNTDSCGRTQKSAFYGCSSFSIEESRYIYNQSQTER
jgi:hypothetical protein